MTNEDDEDEEDRKLWHDLDRLMTVGEFRKRLERFPDDMPLAVFDDTGELRCDGLIDGDVREPDERMSFNPGVPFIVVC